MIDRARFNAGPRGIDNEPRYAITEEGQPYLDEPVFIKDKPIVKMAAPNAVSQVFGQKPLPMLQPNVIRRTPLRWVKPPFKGAT